MAAPETQPPGTPQLEGSHTAPPVLTTPPVGGVIPPLPSAAPLTAPSPATSPSPTHQKPFDDATAKQQHPPHPNARQRRAPQVRAALSYAIPFAPAIWLLTRERHARFVRLHAAQSLAFFGLLALGQVALCIALIGLGEIITEPNMSLALGALFLLLFIVLALGGFSLWLLLLADAMAGRLYPYLGLSQLATLIERGATRLQQRLARGDGFRSRAAR